MVPTIPKPHQYIGIQDGGHFGMVWPLGLRMTFDHFESTSEIPLTCFAFEPLLFSIVVSQRLFWLFWKYDFLPILLLKSKNGDINCTYGTIAVSCMEIPIVRTHQRYAIGLKKKPKYESLTCLCKASIARAPASWLSLLTDVEEPVPLLAMIGRL